MKPLKLTGYTAVTLILIISVEALLLMLTTGTVINSLTLPIVNNFDFLLLLVKSNFWSGLLELTSQPVLILGHGQATADKYLTALYYYPISSLLHIGLALLISVQLLQQPATLCRLPFIIGSVLLLVSINYVWLAGCCGAEPGWTLNTMFLNYKLSTQGSPVAYMDTYVAIYAWMQPLQIILMALSGILLWWAVFRKKGH